MDQQDVPKTLVDSVRSRPVSLFRSNGVVGYPFYWQVPAATEKAAYDGMVLGHGGVNFSYVGIPWATVIDGVRNDAGVVGELLSAVQKVWELSDGGGIKARCATVSQHIHADRFVELFEACGVTDLFWSHARLGQKKIGSIRVHPFPLFPAQVQWEEETVLLDDRRPWLANFIGAYNPGIYLSDVRQRIFEDHEERDLLIVKRDAWHFDRQVYSQQILGRDPDQAEISAEAERKAEYIDAIRNSTFTLCPTGSGPNSIRIAEALALGSIPIILTRDLALSGDSALWNAACLFEDDNVNGYRRAIARARAMSEDECRTRRHATQELFAAIGPQSYGDIVTQAMGDVESTTN